MICSLVSLIKQLSSRNVIELKWKVKWDNIFIQGEEKPKGKSSKKEDKNKNESIDSMSSKLAVILYEDNILGYSLYACYPDKPH